MHDPLTRRGFGAMILVASLCSSLACARQSETTPPAPTGELVHTLVYAPGPAWKPGEPMSSQGLEPHMSFMAQHFGDGTLVANGPFGDAVEGFYVFALQEREQLDAIVAADPAVRSGVLALQRVEPWLLVMDGLDASPREGESLYVLEYTAGPAWTPGRPMLEQDVGPHIGYVSGLFAEHQLVAGGPIPGADRGRYIVSARDDLAARALVDDDPGVRGGLFVASVRPWMVAQRQSARRSAPQ